MQKNYIHLQQDLSREEYIKIILDLQKKLDSKNREIKKLSDENDDLKEKNKGLEEALELSKVKTTSKNSSLPPSMDISTPAKKHECDDTSECGNSDSLNKKVRKKSVGRKGYYRPLEKDPDETIQYRIAEESCKCGGELGKEKLSESYDKVGIEIRKVVTRVERYTRKCKKCHKKYKGEPSESHMPGTPFTEEFQCLLIYLRYKQNIPYKRLCNLCHDILGVHISQGALRNMIARNKSKLDSAHADILEKIKASDFIASDETSVRVCKQKFWQWLIHTKDYVYHLINKSRSKQILDDLMDGVMPLVWTSDLYGGQLNRGDKMQVCLAHQVRDCQKAIDEGDKEFGEALKALFYDAMKYDKESFHKDDAQEERKKLNQRLQDILDTPNVQKPMAKRLLKRYKKHQDNLFTFLDYEEVDSTNNESERILRPTKTFMKVTNCFRSDLGYEFFSAIQSIFGTALKQGSNEYESLKQLLIPNTS